MPYVFDQDPSGVRCTLRYSGPIDADVLVEATQQAARRLRGPVPECLVDGKQIRSLDLDPEGFDRVLEVGYELMRRMGPGRSAFVVDDRYHPISHLYLVRMKRRLAESDLGGPPRELSVFRTEAEGRAWLAEGRVLPPASPPTP